MKNLKNYTFIVLAVGFIITGCESSEDSLINSRLSDNPLPDPVELTGTQGNADFTNFVSIGNSLTAGFMDGALYNAGQQNSLGALIAGRLKIAVESDGDTFNEYNQPDINSVNGFNTAQQLPGGSPVLGRIKLDLTRGIPSPTINGDPITAYAGNKSELNNFGVPGIQVGQLLTPGTGNPADPAFNPFYARMASNPGASTILGDVMATNPTFFSLWIGSNDILGYAISGASNPAIFTSAADFNTRYNAVIGTLLSSPNVKGVVANIPPVTTIPFFRAVRWNNIALDAPSAAALNQGLAGVNGALDGIVAALGHDAEDAARRKINYTAGNNPILVIDEELEDLGPKFDQLQGAGAINATQRAALVPYEQSRPLVAGELVLLTAGSVLGTNAAGPNTPIGVAIPLGFNVSNGTLDGDRYYLSLAEQQEIAARTLEFNTTIATAALTNPTRLALFDVNAGLPGNPNTQMGVFADLLGFDGELGIRVEGVLLNPDFLPNGIYSADGVHPNIRGNAILANYFIEAIKNKFDSEIPRVEVLPLPGPTACSGDCLSQQ